MSNPSPARRRTAVKICVVALGKIGLPLAVQCARHGSQRARRRHNDEGRRAVNAGRAPFPGEANLAEYLAEVVGAGRLRRDHRHRRGCRLRDVVVIVVPLVVDEDRVPTFARWTPRRRRRRRDSARHARQLRDDAAGRHHAPAFRTGAWPGSGLLVGATCFVCPAQSASTRAGSSPTCAPTPSSSAASTTAESERAVEFYEAALEFDQRPDLGERTACGTWARPRRPSWPSSRRRRTATSTSPSPTARDVADARRRRLRGHRRVEQSAVQSHPPAWHRGRRALHPRVPAVLPER